jgi:hypothetical protein
VIAFLLISALYFADTLLRASLKTFWYDELATVFLCRLPSFHATWTAVLHGSDFNPPLFYLLTRWGQHFSGEGLIASRLPAIIGFWVFGVCLFVFVTRRLGPLPACIAALFPVFTLAHVYAYEARPHGATLAWSGLMLVGWQHARQGRNFSLWTLAFWLSWLGALLTHVYAVYLLVPFLAVEALGLIKEWRPHLGIVISMLLGPICVAPLYLRMAHTYRSATSIGGLHIHPYEVLQQYLVSLVGPGIVLLLLFLLLVSFERLHKSEEAPAALSGGLLPQELWLAVLLGCLPLFGAIGVKLSHGPFFNRYFLSATAGYAILLAQAAFPHSRRSLAVKGLVAAMLFLLTSDLAIAEYCRWHHADLDQVEPASLFHFPLDSRQPLSRDAALLNNHFTHDILVPEPHLFLYLYYYASPELRQRLYLGILTTTDFSLAAYRQGAHWAQLDDTRFVSFDQFFATHSDFFLYNPVNGNQNGACYDCLQPILNAGYTLRSVDRDTDNLLEHFSK